MRQSAFRCLAAVLCAAPACGSDDADTGTPGTGGIDANVEASSPGADAAIDGDREAATGDGGADAATCEAIAARVISDTVTTSGPRLAFNGTGYGVAWADPRDRADGGADGGADDELYFARLDERGVRIGNDVRVTNAPGNLAGVAISWDGSGYEVAFNDTRPGFALFSTRLDANGVKLYDEVNIAALGTPPSLAVSGSSVGLIWSNANVQFARKPQGQSSFGAPAMVATGMNPTLAKAGSGWGIVFHSDKVYFAFLDAQGTKTSGDLQVSDGAGYRAAVAAGSGGFGVAWGTDLAASDVVFARLDGAGARIGNEIPLSSGLPNDGLPVVAAGRGGYAVAWVTTDAHLVFRFIDASGSPAALQTLSTTALQGGYRPLDIVANGGAFTLAWLDTREGASKPFVMSICP